VKIAQLFDHGAFRQCSPTDQCQTREISRNVEVWDEWRAVTLGVHVLLVRVCLCRRTPMHIACARVRVSLCMCVCLCCAGNWSCNCRYVCLVRICSHPLYCCTYSSVRRGGANSAHAQRNWGQQMSWAFLTSQEGAQCGGHYQQTRQTRRLMEFWVIPPRE